MKKKDCGMGEEWGDRIKTKEEDKLRFWFSVIICQLT